MFKLKCKDKFGYTKTFKYDQLNNSLLAEDNGEYIKYEFKRKEDRIKFMKGYKVRIALGKKCNATCKYCIQEKQKDTAFFTTDFVDKILELTNGNIVNIQFWGGETLLYFDKIVQLYEKFNNRTIDYCNFGICTNGILLKEKHIRDWILNHRDNFGFNLSHDGPGQILRGIDPLKNKDIVDFLKEIIKTNGDSFSINPVMSKYNQDLLKYKNYICEILDTNTVTLSECRPIIIVDENSLKCAMNHDELVAYSKRTTQQLLTYKFEDWSFARDAFDFMSHSLGKSYKTGARCFVGDKKTIVIDTEGNILPCQGFTKDSVDQYGNSMFLGNLRDIKNIKELPLANTPRLIEKQEKCKECVLANICSNGCPYGPIKYEDVNCMYSYYYMLPHFVNSIYKLTDTILTKIEKI